MKKEESKPIVQTTLTFFSSQLTDFNNKRLHLNRGKGLAKFLAKSKLNLRSLTPLDTSMGVMSFSLYMLRFSINAALLIQLWLSQSQEVENEKLQKKLYYDLFNDCLWSVVNLSQFFWLSFSISNTAGLYGMQLETLAQFTDLIVMLLRFQQEKEEYELKYKKANAAEREVLAIEWHHKEFNTIRSLITGLAIATLFGLYSLSVISIPISPFIASIVLITSLVRVLNDIDKDSKLIYQLKKEEVSSLEIINKERLDTKTYLNDLNQIALNCIFLPLAIFLLATAPMSWFIMVSLSILVSHYFLSHLIDSEYKPLNLPRNVNLP